MSLRRTDRTFRTGVSTAMAPWRSQSGSGSRRRRRRGTMRLPAIPLALVFGGFLGVLATSATPVRDTMADWFAGVTEAFSSASLDVSPDGSVGRPVAVAQISVVDGDTV